MRAVVLTGTIAAFGLVGTAYAAPTRASALRDARTFIAKFDADADGRLSYAEFPCQPDPTGNCDLAGQNLTLEMYDRNNDGFIDAAEFAARNAVKTNDKQPAPTGKD